jgi:hypothetical protein
MNYYQLATTGGGSRLRGPTYGEFDHVAWVTMKKDAPLIANVMLDGILPEDLKMPDSQEKGSVRKVVPTYPVSLKVTLDGKPLAGATVTFMRQNPEPGKRDRFQFACDGLTDEAGRMQMSTYGRFDGSPAGEYVVTAVKTAKGGYYDSFHSDEKTQLPEKYKSPETTPLKVTVKEGANDLTVELTAKE